MSVWTWARKVLWGGGPSAREIIDKLEELNEKRSELDKKLLPIVRATVDGDPDWFKRLPRKDPACVLDILKDCCEVKINDNHT